MSPAARSHQDSYRTEYLRTSDPSQVLALLINICWQASNMHAATCKQHSYINGIRGRVRYSAARSYHGRQDHVMGSTRLQFCRSIRHIASISAANASSSTKALI